LVFKELDKRTIYTLIAKPIHRYQFILGKYGGLLLTLLVEVSIMTVGLFLYLFFFSEKGMDFSLLKAIFLIYVELGVITAVAILFSSFSTPFLSGLFTLSIFIIGHLTDDLLVFSERFDAFGQRVANFIYYVFPNLSLLNLQQLKRSSFS